MKKSLNIAVFILTIVLLAGSAFGANISSQRNLKETVKFAVWHEGCRIYAEDNSIGDLDEIRECLVAVYPQDMLAQNQMKSATKSALLTAVRTASRDIPREHQLENFFNYAAKHEGLLARFREMSANHDFEGIRMLYFETFRDNENARNLLAATSDQAVANLVRGVK